VSDSIISSVEAFAMPIPLARPIASALGSYTHLDCTTVLVHTRNGPTGAGFNLGLGGAASRALVPYIENELAPLAIGQEALAPEALWGRLWGMNKARMRAGLGVWALSALDIAVWDIVGKVAGLPLHRLLGGFRNPVPVYGSGGWLNLSDRELVSECEGFAAGGIGAYKYKIGGPRDRERTALLRQATGPDFVLLADANQAFTVRQAREAARMLADHRVGWLEEPVLADSTTDLALVASGSEVPVAAGENVYFSWGFRELCIAGAAAYLQPDVTRCGGITEFRKIAALADSFRLALSSHLWHELSISLVGAFPSGYLCEYAELIPPELLTREFPLIEGAIEVPDLPGHGVEFTREAIRRFRN
jgi:D-arabinonate dehydratase